jgi:hypothetical protein
VISVAVNYLDLSVVLKDQLEAFLETRRAVAALIVVLEKSIPDFREKYEEALRDPKSSEFGQPNPQWVSMAVRVLTDLRSGVRG